MDNKVLKNLSEKLRAALRKQAHPIWGISRGDRGVFIERKENESAERQDEYEDENQVEVTAGWLNDWLERRQQKKDQAKGEQIRKDLEKERNPQPPAGQPAAPSTPPAAPVAPPAPAAPPTPAATQPSAKQPTQAPSNRRVVIEPGDPYDQVKRAIGESGKQFLVHKDLVGGLGVKIIGVPMLSRIINQLEIDGIIETADQSRMRGGRAQGRKILKRPTPNGDMPPDPGSEAIPDKIPRTSPLPEEPPKKGAETAKYISIAEQMIPKPVDVERIIRDYLADFNITDFGTRPGDDAQLANAKNYAQAAYGNNMRYLKNVLIPEMEQYNEGGTKRRQAWNKLVSWVLELDLRDQAIKNVARGIAYRRGRDVERERARAEGRKPQPFGVGGSIKTAAKGDYQLLVKLLLSYRERGVNIADAATVTKVLAKNPLHGKVLPVYQKLILSDPDQLNIDVDTEAYAKQQRIDALEAEENGEVSMEKAAPTRRPPAPQKPLGPPTQPAPKTRTIPATSKSPAKTVVREQFPVYPDPSQMESAQPKGPIVRKQPTKSEKVLGQIDDLIESSKMIAPDSPEPEYTADDEFDFEAREQHEQAYKQWLDKYRSKMTLLVDQNYKDLIPYQRWDNEGNPYIAYPDPDTGDVIRRYYGSIPNPNGEFVPPSAVENEEPPPTLDGQSLAPTAPPAPAPVAPPKKVWTDKEIQEELRRSQEELPPVEEELSLPQATETEEVVPGSTVTQFSPATGQTQTIQPAAPKVKNVKDVVEKPLLPEEAESAPPLDEGSVEYADTPEDVLSRAETEQREEGGVLAPVDVGIDTATTDDEPPPVYGAPTKPVEVVEKGPGLLKRRKIVAPTQAPVKPPAPRTNVPVASPPSLPPAAKPIPISPSKPVAEPPTAPKTVEQTMEQSTKPVEPPALPGPMTPERLERARRQKVIDDDADERALREANAIAKPMKFMSIGPDGRPVIKESKVHARPSTPPRYFPDWTPPGADQPGGARLFKMPSEDPDRPNQVWIKPNDGGKFDVHGKRELKFGEIPSVSVRASNGKMTSQPVRVAPLVQNTPAPAAFIGMGVRSGWLEQNKAKGGQLIGTNSPGYIVGFNDPGNGANPKDVVLRVWFPNLTLGKDASGKERTQAGSIYLPARCLQIDNRLQAYPGEGLPSAEDGGLFAVPDEVPPGVDPANAPFVPPDLTMPYGTKAESTFIDSDTNELTRTVVGVRSEDGKKTPIFIGQGVVARKWEQDQVKQKSESKQPVDPDGIYNEASGYVVDFKMPTKSLDKQTLIKVWFPLRRKSVWIPVTDLEEDPDHGTLGGRKHPRNAQLIPGVTTDPVQNVGPGQPPPTQTTMNDATNGTTGPGTPPLQGNPDADQAAGYKPVEATNPNQVTMNESSQNPLPGITVGQPAQSGNDVVLPSTIGQPTPAKVTGTDPATGEISMRNVETGKEQVLKPKQAKVDVVYLDLSDVV